MARLLELYGVNSAYGRSRVLYDVDLCVDCGETVALLGRNGAGKTTLLRTIVGLHAPAQGRIVFDGTDVTLLSPFQRARRGLGYVPQGRGIFAHLTVEENLELGLAALAGRKLTAAAKVPAYVYDLFPVLGRVRRRKAGVLSGGEQQQLAIARALATAPKLLILDEPTEGIQPSIVQQIDEAIKHIQRDLNIAILLVEQFLDFVWSSADRFYVMRGGYVADEGRPRERNSDSVVHLLAI
jgi:urea transport system ATP-binding protein